MCNRALIHSHLSATTRNVSCDFQKRSTMSRFNAVRVLFILKIFFQLFNEIVSDERILENATVAKNRGVLQSKGPEIELIEDLVNVTGDESTCGVRIRTISHRNMSTDLYCVERGIIDSGTTGIFYAYYQKQAYHKVAYVPHPNIFERLLVDFYQNSEVGAALAFINDTRGTGSIIGVIDGEYIAKSMPMEQWKLITKFSSSETNSDKADSSVTESTNSEQGQNEESQSKLGISEPTEKPQEHSERSNAETTDQCDTDYPKLLISADYASVQKYENVDDFLMELMGYFNVVDMMYRQFDDPKIRLKITGIIIPRDELATPYVAPNSSTTEELNGAQLMRSTLDYFGGEKHRFPAYMEGHAHTMHDVVMVMVKNRFTDLPIKNSSYSACWNKDRGDIRINNERGGALKYDATFEGITLFADTLARSFEVDFDPDFPHGCGLCSKGSPHLWGNTTNDGKPIRWAPCVYDHLKSFLRSNRISCNDDRPEELSDEVRFMRGAWMHGNGQCQNKHENSTSFCWVDDTCKYHGCKLHGRCVAFNKPPMVGTLLPNGQRCINGKWSNSPSTVSDGHD